MTSTQFNPFGEHEAAVNDSGRELDRICEIFVKELDADTTKLAGLSLESKKICGVLEDLGNIVKRIHDSAVQSLLSEIVTSLSRFIENLSQKSEKLRPSDMMVLSRTVSKFIQIIADRIAEPFNSERLEQWAPLFEALVTSKIILLKDVGIVLWKATFAKVKTSLRYPGQLRQSLEKLPKKNGIVLPADEKKADDSIIFDNDAEEAMDGMESGGGVQIVQDSSQSSFQFSQQPQTEEMAERLLREQKTKLEAVSEKEKEKGSNTPRRRQSKLPTLLDEDSCDFVAITATPPSANRKNRLTDRQKEKLMEAATAPRTTINYVNEESQSGFQKTEQIKAALSAMNYDVGEDSVSVPCPKIHPKVEVKVEEQSEESKESDDVIRRSSARNRKLFEDSPTKLPVAEPESSLKSEKSEGSEETDEKVDEEPAKKRAGRPKKTPKRAEIKKRPSRKESSSDVILKSPEAKKTDSEAMEDVQEGSNDSAPTSSRRLSKRSRKLFSDSPAKDFEDGRLEKIPKLTEIEQPKRRSMRKAADSEDVTKPEAVPEKNSEVVSTEDVPEKTSEVVKDSEEALEASPPKTPRTPSILRTSRRDPGRVDSPITEKKKNRVHFGEESLDMPVTPRRSQKLLTVEVKSPPKTDRKTSVELSDHPMGLLEIEDPTSSTSPFYRTLVGCNDPIDRVVRNLAPLCLKTAVDAVKKSLQSAGVRTVGEFAALSKKQIGELNGLKHPKEKCARSVLAEYEAKKRAEVRASEERIVAEPSPLKQMAKIGEDVEMEEASSAVVPAEDVPEKVVNQPEPVEEVATHQKTTEEPVQKVLEPSESPASTVSPAAEEVRRNLIPVFNKSQIKTEVQSPVKQLIRSAPPTSSMSADSRALHRICSNLSRAHSLNQLPSEKWTGLLDTVNKSAILFKNIVQERGSRLAEWDDVDVENNDNEGSPEVLAPEDDVKSLRAVYRRISRHHALGDVDVATWKSVMETINEAACLLRSIIVERAPR